MTVLFGPRRRALDYIGRGLDRMIDTVHGPRKTYNVRVELGVHDEPALLPVNLAEILLARSAGVRSGGIDLYIK